MSASLRGKFCSKDKVTRRQRLRVLNDELEDEIGNAGRVGRLRPVAN